MQSYLAITRDHGHARNPKRRAAFRAIITSYKRYYYITTHPLLSPLPHPRDRNEFLQSEAIFAAMNAMHQAHRDASNRKSTRSKLVSPGRSSNIPVELMRQGVVEHIERSFGACDVSSTRLFVIHGTPTSCDESCSEAFVSNAAGAVDLNPADNKPKPSSSPSSKTPPHP